MKIRNSYNKVIFKSGLNKSILKQEQSINVNIMENIFLERYNIESIFKENKSASLANKYCLKIFCELAKKFNLNFLSPPTICIYNKNQLLDNTLADNFCIQETTSILKKDYPFPGRSIFFKNFKNLEEIDEITEMRYKNHGASSPHFLSPFIHEWLHSFHLDFIYKKFGYDGDCTYMQQVYQSSNNRPVGIKKLKELETKTLSLKENEIVYNILGEYATRPQNQYLEVLSEAFTKFICESLDGIQLIKNPFDNLLKTDFNFQKILKKIITY